MANIIGVIINVEDDDYQGKDFKKVTLGTGQVLRVKYGREGALKAKWGLLQIGTAIKFTMGEYQGKPFVSGIETVEGGLAPPIKPTILPEHEGIIEEAVKPQPSGQEVGMWWKQLGDDLRSGHIDKSTPHGKLLRAKYFAQMFCVLSIKIEDKKEE